MKRPTESQIELKICELLREHLGFNDETANHQLPLKGRRGKCDIVLRLPGGILVIIEVKHPSNFNKPEKQDKAIKQAADYILCHSKAEYGIVTDGTVWIYFKVVPKGKYHEVHRILGFNAKEHPRAAMEALSRSKRSTLKSFMKVLAAIHRDLTLAEFDHLMDASLAERVNALANKASENGLRVSQADRAVIKALYSGGWLPVQFAGYLVRKEEGWPLKVLKNDLTHYPKIRL